MSMKLKNRCTVILKQNGETIGTYRPNQRKFYSIQKKLEPYRALYPKAKTFKSRYRVVLNQEKVRMGTYKVTEQIFNNLKSDIEQYRSYGFPSKKVRCVETGEIFDSAKKASRWIELAKDIDFCNMGLIKQCCRGKQKTSYGYHWEFVNEDLERFKTQLHNKINN